MNARQDRLTAARFSIPRAGHTTVGLRGHRVSVPRLFAFALTNPTDCILAVVFVIAAGDAAASEPLAPPERASLLVVRGADGTDEFGRMFDEWESRWREAAARGDAAVRTIGTSTDIRPLDEFRRAIADETTEDARPLWIVLIGHGTFDGRDAKFNLTGPDVSADELAAWLQPVQRPVAVINCAAASAPFLNRLSGPGRVVITATKTGSEVNFARFGEFLSQAIGDLTADLDKDGQVSLLEAFLTASRRTQGWYEGLQQLPTEHALLDDNGDGRGVREDFFEGLQPVKATEEGAELDGHRARQWHLIPSEAERQFPDALRPRRNELELEIARLRDQKAQFPEDAYYERLEPLLVGLARLYEQADQASADEDGTPRLAK